MKYEYYCTECKKLTEVTCSIKDTTESIKCECGETALKYFGHELGSSSKPTYYEANFFLLRPSQRQNTFHIPSDRIIKPKIRDN